MVEAREHSVFLRGHSWRQHLTVGCGMGEQQKRRLLAGLQFEFQHLAGLQCPLLPLLTAVGRWKAERLMPANNLQLHVQRGVVDLEGTSVYRDASVGMVE